jgi:hypothetical protein
VSTADSARYLDVIVVASEQAWTARPSSATLPPPLGPACKEMQVKTL